MKKQILSLLMLAVGATSASADDVSLNLMMKDRTVHSFLLSQEPEITIANDVLTIKTGTQTATYNLYEVKEYSFGDPTTGISAVEASQVNAERQGDQLVISGLKDAVGVSIYNIAGQQVPATVISASAGSVTLSLAALPTGTYIVKANGLTLKIAKK